MDIVHNKKPATKKTKNITLEKLSRPRRFYMSLQATKGTKQSALTRGKFQLFGERFSKTRTASPLGNDISL